MPRPCCCCHPSPSKIASSIHAVCRRLSRLLDGIARIKGQTITSQHSALLKSSFALDPELIDVWEAHLMPLLDLTSQTRLAATCRLFHGRLKVILCQYDATSLKLQLCVKSFASGCAPPSACMSLLSLLSLLFVRSPACSCLLKWPSAKMRMGVRGCWPMTSLERHSPLTVHACTLLPAHCHVLHCAEHMA